MRDHERVLARLSVALMVGLTSCKDDEAKSEAVHVAFGEIKTSQGDDDEDEQDDGKGDADAGGSTGGSAEGESTGAPAKKSDPNDVCGGADNVITKEKAARDRLTVDEVDGCPRTVLSTSLEVLDYTVDEDATEKLRDEGDTEHCCYTPRSPKKPPTIRRGRPYMIAGALHRPRAHVGVLHASPELVGPVGRRVAAGWIADARMEWASVASFRRAAAELALQGAPPPLLRDYFVAADEEAEHTRLCLTLARRSCGREITLAPLPDATPRDADLAQTLRWTFAEGCVAETAASLVAYRAARGATDEQVASTLRQIADDEAGHAALAWRTVGWIWQRLDEQARGQFLAWAQTQRPAPASAGEDPDVAHGRLGRATQAAVEADAWDRCIAPLLTRLTATAESADGIRPRVGYDRLDV